MTGFEVERARADPGVGAARTVTRIEIADLIGDAFGPSGADRAALLGAAAERGAHPRVLAKLEELPNGGFRTMRDLWDHLPEVPIDHD